MKKKQSNPFNELQSAAAGMAGLSLTTAIGAGIASKAPPGSPNLTEGFNTLSGFAPIAGLAVGAKTVLNVLPKTKRRY